MRIADRPGAGSYRPAVPIELRPAVPTDAGFLVEMLVAAVFWRPDEPSGSVRDVLDRPELAHYVADWPRPGDLGVVAEGHRLIANQGAASGQLVPHFHVHILAGKNLGPLIAT